MWKLIVFCILSQVNGFAVYLTDDYCDREIREGVFMMGNALSMSNDRNLTVTTSSGVSFQSGEKIVRDSTTVLPDLHISLFPKSPQSVIEIRSDVMRFKDGYCNSTRVVQKGELEFIPGVEISSVPVQVALIAAWTESSSFKVKVTREFILNVEMPSLIQSSSTSQNNNDDL